MSLTIQIWMTKFQSHSCSLQKSSHHPIEQSWEGLNWIWCILVGWLRSAGYQIIFLLLFLRSLSSLRYQRTRHSCVWQNWLQIAPGSILQCSNSSPCIIWCCLSLSYRICNLPLFNRRHQDVSFCEVPVPVTVACSKLCVSVTTIRCREQCKISHSNSSSGSSKVDYSTERDLPVDLCSAQKLICAAQNLFSVKIYSTVALLHCHPLLLYGLPYSHSSN